MNQIEEVKRMISVLEALVQQMAEPIWLERVFSMGRFPPKR